MRTTAVLTVITLSAWSAGAAADAAPTGFDGAIAEYDALRVGDEAIAVSDLALTSGHLQLVMSRGRAAPVFAGDRRVGLFFEGSGRLEYLSAEPAEYPVMAFNAARGSDVRTEKRGGRMRILDEFRGLLFLSPNGPAIVPGGAPAAALSDAFRKHREKFLRDRGFLLSHQLALWALDVPASRPARAEISGGRDDLVHVFDPAWDGSETLYALERRQSDDPEMRRRLWPTLLSRQAIDRDRGVVAPPHFLLTGVEYTLVASGAKEVTARLRETLLPLDTGVRVLDFDLSSDLYGHPGCRPAKRRSLHLRGASSAAGRPLAVDHRDDEVLVDLGAAPPAGTPVEIQFEIDGDFLIHPNQDEFWDLGSEAWFPQPGLSARAYSLHATVKAKKPYVPFASGETVFRGEEGEYNVVETKLEKPTAFTAVVAGKYRFQETSRGGLTIRVASYGGRDPESWDRLTNLAYAAVGFYQSFLGPFPCREYEIVEIHDLGFGVAPACTMFITSEAFHPGMGTLNQVYSKGVNARFAHEIAHQYWGHVVRPARGEDVWLSEAFAEYSAALFIRELKGEPEYRSIVARWKSLAGDASTASPVAYATRLQIRNDPTLSEYRTFQLIYAKGAYLLFRLHAELGNELFRRFLLACQEKFNWKAATTGGVADVLRSVTGRDYSSFFEDYYWGTALPE